MSDTTDPTLLDQIRGGTWRSNPGHVEPPPLAGPGDPVAQMLASLPAEVPTTPLPDAVAAGETAGELTPGGPQWSAAPPEEMALSEGATAPQGAPGAQPTPAPPAGQETARQPAPVPIITVAPGELLVGDVIQFAAGPVSLVLQQGDLWVCHDCTVRYLAHLTSIPVVRP